MPRPKTKEELMQCSAERFNKLVSLVQSMGEEGQRQEFSFMGRDRNVRDVLAHLYEWHRLLLEWIHANGSGLSVDFLPKPYNWRTYPEMNIAFWQKHQDTTFDDAWRLLHQSHAEVMTMVEGFSQEELFTKCYFPWTGTTSLGSYCISSTSSHYEWAIKLLKKHQKSWIFQI